MNATDRFGRLQASVTRHGTAIAPVINRKLLIFTTTWWASAALLAFRLQRAGFEVTLLCPRGHPARAQPGLNCIDLPGRAVLRTLRDAIARTDPRMLVPMDDRAVRYVHALHDVADAAVRALIEASVGPPASFPIATSRPRFSAAARAVGMATPAEADVRSLADVHGHLARAGAPLVLKLDGTAGGRGVAFARTRREAARAFRRLHLKRSVAFAFKQLLVDRDPFWLVDWAAGRRPSLSAQHVVRGRSGDLAMFCLDGKVLGLAVAEAESCGGETGPSTFVHLADHPMLAVRARALAAELKLSGFFGLDFIVDAASGEEVVIELNPRMTALCGLAADRPDGPIAAAAAALLGSPAGPAGPERPRVRRAHFPFAWLAHPGDRRLEQCRDDIPPAHPALIAEMLKQSWNHRGPVARLFALPRHIRREQRAARAGGGAAIAGWSTIGAALRPRARGQLDSARAAP